MMGDYHVRFCERLAGENPACLLGLIPLIILFTLFYHDFIFSIECNK